MVIVVLYLVRLDLLGCGVNILIAPLSASNFFVTSDPFYSGYVKMAYGCLFPGAFVAVVYTGTELFTGNTVTMMMLLFHEGKSVLRDLCRIWTYSLIGNCAGAVFGAFLISFLSGAFDNPEGKAQLFLFYLADGKCSKNFGQNIVLGEEKVLAFLVLRMYMYTSCVCVNAVFRYWM